MASGRVGTVKKWEICELAFSAKREYDNPFRDVSLAAFFDDGVEEHAIDGFYDGSKDGKDVWKIRFAPPREGRWSFRTVSNDAGLGGQQGDFTCVAAASRGGLETDHRFPNWFFRADGQPQFIVNDGWAPHPGFKNVSEHGDLIFDYPTEDEYRTYLRILGDHRVNLVLDFNQSYARQGRISDPSFRWPWKVIDAARNRIDRDRFNLLFYQRLDRMLAFAKERGIFYGLELLYDKAAWDAFDWAYHPWNAKNGGWIDDKDGDGRGWAEIFDLRDGTNRSYITRYLEYTIARTAAYWNVFYVMGAETGNMDRGREAVFAEWFDTWGDLIARKDPHGRLLAIGDTGECVRLVRHKRNNVLLTQEHTSMKDPKVFYTAIDDFGKRFWGYGRPVFIGEQDRFNNNRYETERRGYWIALTRGFMMGRVDRHFDVAAGDRLFESELFRLKGHPPIYADLRLMADFIDKAHVKFWRMSPHDDLLSGQSEHVYCLAEPGVEYLVYFAQGGQTCVKAVPGQYAAEWFDPRSGRSEAAQGRSSEGFLLFAAADNQDWVLHIRAGQA